MTDYTVRARFEADANGYIQAVNQAKQATEGLGDAADKAGKSTGKAFDGADKSVNKTGQAAESASKQTAGLGDSASKAGQDTQAAFDGAEAGIEATGASAEAAGASVEGVGQSATQATQELQSAFDAAQSAVASSSAKVEQAKQNEVAAIQRVRDAEQQLNAARASGDQTAVIAASANLAKAKDDAATSTRNLVAAEKELTAATQSAASAQDALAASARKTGPSLQQVTQGIRNNADDLKTVGSVVATVGGAWTAFNATMAATGIQYNTLQQVAAKSMQTMMGSIEGANRQMERFHAFADDSPFSRATFIEAQRQLMAFGMEADRVIPSLEGIQNAVAAIGGGNNEILRLTEILGAIQGQGKITGRELQRMGQMGIDAADIIGEQMGKSGAAIRDEITKGTLDADTAIEALTTGMAQRFDGAAAGLKETFEGAIDRVKAAFRDLSGDMFEWAVGSEGGGFLTGALNSVADFIREIEKLPAPVKNAMGIISTLGGAATLAAGGFLVLAPQALQAWDAFVKLSNATGATKLMEGIQTKAPGAGKALRTAGRYALYAAAAFAALQAISSAIPSGLDQIADSADIADVLQNMGNNADYARDRVNDMLSVYVSNRWSGTPMGDFMDNFTGQVESLGDAMSNLDAGALSQTVQGLAGLVGFETDIKVSTEALETFDSALSSMASSNDWDGLSAGMQLFKTEAEEAGHVFEDMAYQHLPGVMEALQGVADDLGVGHKFKDAAGQAELLEWALTGVPPAAIEAAGGLDSLEGSASELDGTLEGVIGKLQAMGVLALSERDALRGFEESILKAKDAVEEHGKVLDKNGELIGKYMEEGIEAQAELDGMADSTRSLMEAQIEAGATHEDIIATYKRGKDAFVETAQAMGMGKEQAKALADELFAIPDETGTTMKIEDFATDVAKAVANEVDALPEHTILGISAQEDGSFVSVQQRIDHLGNPITVLVDAEGNITEVTERIMEIDGHRATVYVDDDGTIHKIESDLEEISQSRHSSTIEVNAETGEYERKTQGLIEESDLETTVDVTADTAQAEADVQDLADMEPTGSVVIVVDDNGTQAEVQQRINSTTGKTETIVVTDNGTVARVQQQIIDVNGVERTVWVDDNGTVYSTQSAIDGITDGSSFVSVTDNSGEASGRIDHAARDRTATITVKTAGSINFGAMGNLAQRAAGGRLPTAGAAGGHYLNALPRHAGGGRLPHTGLGTDMILGVNSQGVPLAWVDDGEWVIRERMSRKYHQALGLINADHPAIHHLAGLAGGGQAGATRLASSVPLTAAAPQVVAGETRTVNYNTNLYGSDAKAHGLINSFRRHSLEESRV